MAPHNDDSLRHVTRTAPGYYRRFRQWQRIRDALEGEQRVKHRAEAYLPKPHGMDPQDFTNYVERASFYGVSDRTLKALTGLVFRVQPQIELPTSVTSFAETATSEGFTLEQSIREGLREVLSLGRYGVLVDRSPSPAVVGEDVPYLATYMAEDIINWEEETIFGRRRLVRVVVIEEPERSGEERRTFLRELFITPEGFYSQRLYEKDESDRDSSRQGFIATRDNEDHVGEIISGNFELVSEHTPTIQGRPFDFIPFWFINPFDARPRTDKPPFLDLVNINIAHYRNSADYEQALYLLSQPQPYIFGVSASEVPKAYGAATIWHSENPDVQAGLLEYTGDGVGSQATAMEKKEQRMAVLGARLISDFKEESNISAETIRLQSRGETSVLIATVQTVSEVYKQAVGFAAAWAGGGGDTQIKLNQDFIETRLSGLDLTALVGGWQMGAFSQQSLHENLQKGEIIDPSVTLEMELERMKKEAASQGLGPVPGGGDMPRNLDELKATIAEAMAEAAGDEGEGGGDA